MGHMLAPRYGVIGNSIVNTEYNADMRTFFAVPGVSGTNRLKIRPAEDTDNIQIRRKQGGNGYSGKSLSTTSQDESPLVSIFSSDGMKIYVLGQVNKTIYQYSLSVAWDIDTATYASKSFYVGGYDTNTRTFEISTDGTKLYTIGWTNDTIYQFTLSTPWDISTASYTSKSFSVASQCTDSANMQFKPDGLSLYITNYETADPNDVYQFTLSTAWDISTASYSGRTAHISAGLTQMCAFAISSDGAIGWAVGNASTTMYKYEFASAWDITTISYTGISLSFSSETSATRCGLIFGDEDRSLYLTNGINDSVYQYYTETGYWNKNDDINSGILVGLIKYYNASTTYVENDWVIYDGDCYRSIQGSNIGNTPDSSSSYWVNTSDLDNNEWYEVDGLVDGTKYYYHCFLQKNGAWAGSVFRPSDVVNEYKLDYSSGDTIGKNDGSDTGISYTSKDEKFVGVFNGSNSYVDLGAPSDFDRTVKMSGNGCAYECWFKADTWGTDETSGLKSIIYDLNGMNMRIGSGASGSISFKIFTDAIDGEVYATGLSLSSWYHMVANFYNDDTLEIFIDSVSQDEASITGIYNTSVYNMSIGGRYDAARLWDGAIGNVRVYDHSLNSTEIEDLYLASADYYKGLTNKFTEPTSLPSSLVHEYKLNQSVEDSVGTNHGTANNVAYEDFPSTKSFHFDGDDSISLGTPSDFDRTVKTAGNGCSYEAWFKVDDASRRTIISDFNGWYAILEVSGGSYIYFWIYNGGVIGISALDTISIGNWYHVVAVINSDYSMEIWVDGVKEAENSNTTVPTSYSNGMFIGSDRGITRFHLGDIALTRWYDHALTQTEIEALASANRQFFKSGLVPYVENGSLPNSLVHYYRLNSNAYDSEGTQDGAVTGGSYNSLGYNSKECAEFDGSSSYIDLGAPSSFNSSVKTAGNGYTYEFWFSASSWGDGATVRTLLSDRNGCNINVQSSASGSLNVGKYNGSTTISIGATGLILNTWYHCVINIYSDNKTELFINGSTVDDSSDTSASDIPVTDIGIYIGEHRLSSVNRFWDGKIDNVRFYSRSLTSDEIADLYLNSYEHYKNESMAKGGGLTHEYTIDEVLNTTLYDTAGNIDFTLDSAVYSEGVIGNKLENTTRKYDLCTSNSNFGGTIYDSDFSISMIIDTNDSSLSQYYFHATERQVFTALISGKIGLYMVDSTPTTYKAESSMSLSEATYYHVVFVRSKTEGLKVYINGQLDGTDSFIANARSFTGDGAEKLLGYFAEASSVDGGGDQFRFYTRALTSYEITQLYNNSLGC